jgi:hypothetical protein
MVGWRHPDAIAVAAITTPASAATATLRTPVLALRRRHSDICPSPSKKLNFP